MVRIDLTHELFEYTQSRHASHSTSIEREETKLLSAVRVVSRAVHQRRLLHWVSQLSGIRETGLAAAREKAKALCFRSAA